jgi:predicted ATPase/class 3 adenylate cyclase
MAELPSGTVTFLFTDLEGSTRLWEQFPDAMRGALARHDAILRAAVAAHEGLVVKSTGDGIHAVFATVHDALDAAGDAQVALAGESWASTGPLKVRMGVHTGEAELRDGDYFGGAANRAARLMSVAHGGQVVVSLATAELARDGGYEFVDLGEHRLRDLARAERVFQLRHAGLVNQFPPLSSLESQPAALPVFLTSFVGRDDELAVVGEALATTRVVTWIGVGGVGKTRLAAQAAGDVAGRFVDGVWFCELAPVTDRGAVPEAVAMCLGASQRPGESLLESVVSFLRQKELLLVLDNCEHVIDAAGSLIETIVHRCPGVVVLATSREALAIDGEVLRPVRPLGVPDDAPWAELVDAPAVRLFADRATAVRPDLALDETNGRAVGEICRQLDGVPLAIELAAARVASLSVPEIARRLDQRFRLLTGGRRTALERHQTLRATVDWSYDLLAAAEAEVFNRLAVFAGGFALDAAEVIVSGDDTPADMLHVLSDLVARNMLAADEQSGMTRYRLLETMRQYARERLDAAGEGEPIRRRHAEYYVTLAEEITKGVRGREDTHWFAIMDQEFANMMAALDWSISAGDADLALRLVTLPIVARSTATVSRVIARITNMPEARMHPLRPSVMASAGIGALELYANTKFAAEYMEAIDEAFEEAGLALSAPAHVVHATVALLTGDVSEMTRHGHLAVELALHDGDTFDAAELGWIVSLLFATAGLTQEAIHLAQQSHTLSVELANPHLLAHSRTTLGYVLSSVDADAAIVHLEEGLALLQPFGDLPLRYTADRCLARLLASRGERRRAFEIYVDILDLSVKTGRHMQDTLTIESLSIDLAAAGYHSESATIISALEHNDAIGNFSVSRDATVELLQRTMSPESYQEHTAQGQTLDPDELVAYARVALTSALTDVNRNASADPVKPPIDAP